MRRRGVTNGGRRRPGFVEHEAVVVREGDPPDQIGRTAMRACARERVGHPHPRRHRRPQERTARDGAVHLGLVGVHRRRHERQRRGRRSAVGPRELRLPLRALEATRPARRARQPQRGAELPFAPRTMAVVHATMRRDRLIRRGIRKARRHIHHALEPPTLQHQRTRTCGLRGLTPKRAAQRQYRGRREKKPYNYPPHNPYPQTKTI